MPEKREPQIGDLVIIRTRWSVPSIERINRVLKRHVEIRGQKYNLRTGYLAGCGSGSQAEFAPSQERLDQVRKQRRREIAVIAIRNARLEDIPLKALEAAAAALQSDTGEKE